MTSLEPPFGMRPGRKVGRTLYRMVSDEPTDEDILVGLVDTPELAAFICDAVNNATSRPGRPPITEETSP